MGSLACDHCVVAGSGGQQQGQPLEEVTLLLCLEEGHSTFKMQHL